MVNTRLSSFSTSSSSTSKVLNVTPLSSSSSPPPLSSSSSASPSSSPSSSSSSVYSIKLPTFLDTLLFDPSSPLLSYLLLFLELLLGISIIEYVPYTEIDWSTYMQHVSLFKAGVRDYYQITGSTGPCVYPAGYLYVYTLLESLTETGVNIHRAQFLFLGIYLCLLFLVHRIYQKSGLPPYLLILLSLSKRIHSIFMLRLFNDGIAMLFLYLSLFLLLHYRYTMTSIFFSCALSIKMNILLFAPAYLLVLLQSLSVHQVVMQLLLMLFIQILLGLPFLLHEPTHYLSKAFEFSRVFFYKWTVNLKILPESVFLHPYTSIILLIAHLVFLLYFLNRLSGKGGLLNVARHGLLGLISNASALSSSPLSSSYIVSIFFLANFVGVVFARSLHYQFYIWYFHSLPFLLHFLPSFMPSLLQSRWPRSKSGVLTLQDIVAIIVRALALLLIEVSWNVFPATAWSSAILICVHLVILILLLMGNFSNERNDTDWKSKDQ